MKSNSTFIQKFQTLKIYKFADKLDVCLLSIGTFGSLASGACFPLLLFIYQQVTDALVNYGKLKYIESMNLQNLSHISCENGGFDVPDNATSPIQSIENVIKWYVLFGFLSILFYSIAFAAYMVAAERQIRRIRYRLFENIIYQEMTYFDTLNDKGKLLNMLTDDLLKIKEGIGDKAADFLSLLARMIGCMAFSLVKGWKLTLVILSISPFVILMFNLTIKFSIKYARKQIQAYAKSNTIVLEVFTTIRTIVAFNGQDKEQKRYANSLTEIPMIGLRKSLVQGLCQIFSNLFMGLVFAAALWYGQYLIKTECRAYSAGRLVVIFIACLNTTWCLSQLIPSLEKFADATASSSTIFQLISKKSKIDASKLNEGVKPSLLKGDIQFRNVAFRYPARPEQTILENTNFTIPNGKTVALVGHSGCGKSTILSLITRLYDPDLGQVRIDSQDIRQLNIHWLRSNIGYVGQEPVLFAGTIEDNIRMGKLDATYNEIEQAAKLANAHQFILDLPQGYQTSAKTMLSGGQKQRIAIARAIISNPKILILDEATSALDNRNAKIVQTALNNVISNRTTIIVAHRMSSIRHADLILVFNRGNLIEQGKHEELMTIENGIYRTLCAESCDEETKQNEIPSDQSMSSLRKQISSSSNSQQMPTEEQIKDKKKQRSLFLDLLKYNSKEKYSLIVGCLCAFLYGGIEPAVAFVYSMIYGLLANPNLDVQSTETRDLSLSIFGIYAFGGIVQCLSTIIFSKAGEALTLRMRLLTFESILKQEISWFDDETNNIASLNSRLSSDTVALKNLTITRLNILFCSMGALIFALVISFMAGWKLTLVVLCFTPLLILSGYLQGRTQTKADQSKITKSFAEQGGRLTIEILQNIRTVVILNQERKFIEQYQDLFNRDFKQQLCKIPVQAIGKAIANSFLYFIHVTAFSYGAKLVESGDMTFAEVFRVFIVINFASMSIGRSTAVMPDYNQAKNAAKRILTICKQASSIDQGVKLDHVEGNIEFRNVDFAYSTQTNRRILKKFNLTCLKDQTTALVGSSGSGKSTVVSLLLRFYQCTNGQILLDNHDIRTLDVKWFRSLIGFVQQEPTLFDRSIAENISYGIHDRNVSIEEIYQVAQQANIHETIVQFPNGYETNCGSSGNLKLSGGQKQRIAIARALLLKPKILLLDEATSALDNQTERIVQEAIDNARQQRTCLTIAHRLTTIQNSEKIVVVEDGTVQEQGRHEKLLEQNGFYSKLYKATQQYDIQSNDC